MIPRFRSRNFGGMLPVGDAYVKHPVGVGDAYAYQLNRDKAIFSSRRRNSASKARSDASVRFTGTIQDTGKLQGRKYERQDQPEH